MVPACRLALLHAKKIAFAYLYSYMYVVVVRRGRRHRRRRRRRSALRRSSPKGPCLTASLHTSAPLWTLVVSVVF